MDKTLSQCRSVHIVPAILMFFLSTVSGLAAMNPATADSNSPSISLSPVLQEEQGKESKYVFDVVIHEPEDMEKLLDRIEQLSSSLPLGDNDPSLALVLHGPEIAFFTRKNYTKYMDLVDRAAALDKKGIIDVKVCDTMIRVLELENADLPDFVEHVPYGPAEVNRLLQQGFIKM